MLPHLPSPSMSAGPQLWEMKSLLLTGGDAHWENCGELQFQEVIPGKADSCPSPIHHHTYPYIISHHKLFVDMVFFFFCAKLHAHVKTFEVGLCLELLNACGLEIASPHSGVGHTTACRVRREWNRHFDSDRLTTDPSVSRHDQLLSDSQSVREPPHSHRLFVLKFPVWWPAKSK